MHGNPYRPVGDLSYAANRCGGQLSMLYMNSDLLNGMMDQHGGLRNVHTSQVLISNVDEQEDQSSNKQVTCCPSLPDVGPSTSRPLIAYRSCSSTCGGVDIGLQTMLHLLSPHGASKSPTSKPPEGEHGLHCLSGVQEAMQRHVPLQ